MSETPRELLIRDLEGRATTLALTEDRIVLGRSTQCQLAYPDDVGLSRQHLAITKRDGQWFAEDLGSKNGTLMNGEPLKASRPFNPGDRLAAGHLTIEFAGATSTPAQNTVVFVESQDSTTATTLVANLDGVLGGPSASSEDQNKTAVMTGNPQTWALIRAGRELAGHRPLNELFEVIMDLSMEAVMAGRGVLMTIEGDQLKVRAARGAGFHISSTVRDRVLKEKTSILVRDAQMDQNLKGHMSIVEQKVRSILAVPLQTKDDVIGLIYLDQPNHIRVRTNVPLELAVAWESMCPAKVYEVVPDSDSNGFVDVRVNNPNCVQCGAITAKGGASRYEVRVEVHFRDGSREQQVVEHARGSARPRLPTHQQPECAHFAP